MVNAYAKQLEKDFTSVERRRVIISEHIADSRAEAIKKLQLPGISIQKAAVIADPTLISNPKEIAKQLSPLLNIEESELNKYLLRKYNRYEEITNKIVPEVSEKIIELKQNPRYKKILRGIQLRNEHWRYYPEKNLASQVIGYLDYNENGQYGIEGRFDSELRGKEGYILGATNISGQQILGGDSEYASAKDGTDILLSIDRVAQAAIEKILEEDLERFDADFGQIVVVEPKTGRILAMVHAPTFDPNEYSEVYKKYEISQEQEMNDREDELFNQRIDTTFDKAKYYRYFNKWGPAVFKNKIVSETYEPGSVMKAVSMAAAINSNEVSPQTTFDDVGPIEVDGFDIKNADDVYAGVTTMVDVINRSLNTGIAFIDRKMGSQLLYEYLKNFGFGEYSDIQLDGEAKGVLSFWKTWRESELITIGFGQGVSSTPLQMAMAFSALANGGYLMKPILVEELRYSDGTVKKYSPQRVRRVISTDTYQKVKAMLANSVSNGIARGGRVKGYTVMGKTGTSQTYKNGKALRGEGTTITSYAGFGPFRDPAFVILVKYDYPKVSQWGSETAAVTFRKVATFMFQHLGIPPDK